MELSVIVPLFNEEESLPLLYEAMVRAVSPLGQQYELLFVDDGSTDSTFAVAADLARKDKHLRVIRFRKNYGQTAAMAAGIDYAQGRTLITMDGDLQNDPDDIAVFIETLEKGYDVVVGWRHDRQDKLITRKIPSRVANWMIGKVTGVPIKDNGCSLKAFRSAVIKQVPLYAEMHRFIPALTSITGARIAEVKVRHHPRQFGVAKYGLSRIYKVLLDLLTIKTLASFATRPLLWFGILAVPALLVSLVSLGFSLYVLLVRSAPMPVPIAGTGVLFGGLTGFLFLCGVLGEVIYKTGSRNLDRLSLLTANLSDQSTTIHHRSPAYPEMAQDE